MLDEPRLLTAVRVVVLVAVHAELINPPSRYRCSIAATHAGEKDDTPASRRYSKWPPTGVPFSPG